MEKLLRLGKLLFVILITHLFYSCIESQEEVSSHFIYLSHTRLNTNDSVYRPIYDIDFSTYDMTLLGGDLALSSFNNDTITEHLDQIFDFKSPTTLWSVGNHDISSLNKWKERTLKNKYHAYQNNDVTFITLDSQDSLSSIVGDQKDFLFNTLDSVQTSSVVLMTHKLIFMNGHPIMDSQIATTCNAGKGDCYYCHNDNNFQDEIYPKLLEVKNRGIQVMWIGGDLGYKTSEFNFVDAQGITFLGNGFWYKKDWNKVLLLSKKEQQPIEYEFMSLDSLSVINNYPKR